MNTENLRRLFFTAMGAVGTALAPTLPYILLCTAAVLGDCLSAYHLSRRVKKAYPSEADRETGTHISSTQAAGWEYKAAIDWENYVTA